MNAEATEELTNSVTSEKLENYTSGNCPSVKLQKKEALNVNCTLKLSILCHYVPPSCYNSKDNDLFYKELNYT